MPAVRRWDRYPHHTWRGAGRTRYNSSSSAGRPVVLLATCIRVYHRERARVSPTSVNSILPPVTNICGRTFFQQRACVFSFDQCIYNYICTARNTNQIGARWTERKSNWKFRQVRPWSPRSSFIHGIEFTPCGLSEFSVSAGTLSVWGRTGYCSWNCSFLWRGAVLLRQVTRSLISGRN